MSSELLKWNRIELALLSWTGSNEIWMPDQIWCQKPRLVVLRQAQLYVMFSNSVHLFLPAPWE